MSLRFKVNLNAIVFDFKNIELCNQGHYYAEVQFYVQTQNAKYYMVPDQYEKMPWNFGQLSTRAKALYRANIDSTSRNGIKSKKAIYKTKGWNIRFTEEETILNEVSYYIAEIDLPASDPEQALTEHRIPLMMEVTLYFLE